MKNKVNSKKIIKSKHFRSLFHTITMIVSVVCLLLMVFFSVKKTTVLVSEIEKDNMNIAHTLKSALKNTQSCATFIGSLPSISLLLNHDSPDIEQLSRMIDDISSFSSIYDYENITLFLEESSRIYDSQNGMYFYADYHNADFLETVISSTDYERWLINNGAASNYAGKETTCLTYIHRLPIFETSAKGYVSFSLPLKYVEKLIESTRSTSYPLEVSFKDLTLLDTLSSMSEGQNTSFFVYNPSYSVDDEITISRHLTLEPFAEMYLNIFLHCLLLYISAICISFVISYYVAIIMLRPVDKLLQNAGLPSFIENNESASDEYDILTSLVNEMSQQIKNKDSISTENKQLIQEQLLYNLLYHYENPLQLPEKYEENDIIFPYKHFTLVLIDFNDFQNGNKLLLDREQIMLFVRKNAEEAFSHISKCYGLYIGSRYIALILNTDYSEHLRNNIHKICTAISVSASETLSVKPAFGITTCSSKAPNLYHAMLQAQRLFLFAEKETDSPIYFSEQKEYTSSVDSSFLIKITQAVINRDTIQLKGLRAFFAEQYTQTISDLAEMRRYCKITISSVYFRLLQLNIKMPESFLVTSISKLEKAQSISECENILFNCLIYSSSDSNKVSDDATLYIQQAISYLELHYFEPITMPQIASHVGISSIYLNRLFKSSTQKTLSEYLNEYRITRSLELLQNKQFTIAYISEQVGYNDVRSYIRFFKKYHKITPNEYRTTKLNQ